jgi:hypothetical protein
MAPRRDLCNNARDPVKAVPAPPTGDGNACWRHLGSDHAGDTKQGRTFLKPTRLCLDDCLRTAHNTRPMPTQRIRPAFRMKLRMQRRSW